MTPVLEWAAAVRPVRTNYRDHILGALLALGYLALLMATAGDIAMSRDESFYVHASERYGAWYELLLEDSDRALTQDVIDQHWEYNHEHPALAKTLFAWSLSLHRAYDIFPTESMAHRFPAMLMSSLILWLIYIFGARVFGREAGSSRPLPSGSFPASSITPTSTASTCRSSS